MFAVDAHTKWPNEPARVREPLRSDAATPVVQATPEDARVRYRGCRYRALPELVPR